MSESTTPTYAEQANVQDQLLEQKLMQISMRLDDGLITPVEAGNARVQAIAHHLLAVCDLNAEYFPEEGSNDAPVSG